MIDIFVDIETIPNQSPEYRAMVRENIKAPAQYKKPDSIAAWLAENADTATDEAIAKTHVPPVPEASTAGVPVPPPPITICAAR